MCSKHWKPDKKIFGYHDVRNHLSSQCYCTDYEYMFEGLDALLQAQALRAHNARQKGRPSNRTASDDQKEYKICVGELYSLPVETT